MRPLQRASLLGVCVLLASPLSAQEQASDVERPRVERISFPGADALDEETLRSGIITRQTRCRGLLLKPFCWITNWGIVVERNYLDREELPRDELRLRVLYFRRGHREASISSEVLPRGDAVEVVFNIEEGPPTIITDLRVTQEEEVLSARRIRAAGFPQPGEPLNLTQLDTAVAHLYRRLGQGGYLDGVVTDSITVSPDGRTADVAIIVDPARRTTVGELVVAGNEDVVDRTIIDATLLREGSVLTSRDLVGSQRSLYESNLFHEARVELPEQADSAKTLQITVREAPPRAARIGGGFNTVEFLQAESRFTHYNWRGGGRRLDLRATVGNLLAGQFSGVWPFQDIMPPGGSFEDESAFVKPTWWVSAELMQPAFRAAANTVGLGLFAHRRTIPGVAIDEGLGASASITRRLDYRTPVSLTYRYELAAVEAGDVYFCVGFAICDLPTIEAVRGRHGLSPVGVSFFTDHANHPLAATSGYRGRLELEHASRTTGSDFQYNRVSGEGTLYHPIGLGFRRVLAGRLRTGWVMPLEGGANPIGLDTIGEALLHPRKRFYSGGSRSVRGYWENQLGPRLLTVDPMRLTDEEGGCTTAEIVDASCDPSAAPAQAFQTRPMGGTTVLEGSVEFRFPLWRQFRGAAFVDGAIVGERIGALFTEGRGAITPGFGARLDTPIGPIRADLGIKPARKELLPVITEYVDEDGRRRLVRLATPREWSTVDARGNFLDRLFAHLTLHLSIGEAY